jgi:hypothetical protein
MVPNPALIGKTANGGRVSEKEEEDADWLKNAGVKMDGTSDGAYQVRATFAPPKN